MIVIHSTNPYNKKDLFQLLLLELQLRFGSRRELPSICCSTAGSCKTTHHQLLYENHHPYNHPHNRCNNHHLACKYIKFLFFLSLALRRSGRQACSSQIVPDCLIRYEETNSETVTLSTLRLQVAIWSLTRTSTYLQLQR